MMQKLRSARHLAMESGEIEGSCWGWDSIKSTWAKALETGDGVVVIQAAAKAHPDLPRVPSGG